MLNVSDQFYAAIVRDSSDAIATIDLDRIITSWNPGAARLYGYAEVEAVGKLASLVIVPERLFRFTAYHRRIMAGESVPSYTSKNRCRDGTLIDVSVTLSPIRDDAGTIVGTSSVIRDVTQQRLDRERLQRNLESRATHDQQREEFLALLAHEIRQPAAAIGLLAEGIARAPEIGDRERAAAFRLREQALLLSTFAEDALAIAHLEGNAARIDLREDDLIRALEAAVNRVGDPRVDARLPKGPLWLRIDRDRLSQAVVNLITNALKYSDAPTPVRLRVCDFGESVRIEVHDKGIGVALDQAEQLFQKYARAHSGQRDPGGVGLGLYLARLVAEAHGGWVHVESAGLGAGSMFAITLPRGVAAQ